LTIGPTTHYADIVRVGAVGCGDNSERVASQKSRGRTSLRLERALKKKIDVFKDAINTVYSYIPLFQEG
jgi:hypothetical protein